MTAALDVYRATIARLHGERFAEAVFRRALLKCAVAVWELAIERRECASEAFLEAWQAEDDRAWLIATRRRPPWLASTWRLQARLADATAREVEWSDLVASLTAPAASATTAARDAVRPRREVLVFDDFGKSHVLFEREKDGQ